MALCGICHGIIPCHCHLQTHADEDARFELFNELRQWMHSHTANALIDAFAHQLAEKQRQYAEDTLDYDTVIEPGQLKTVIVAAVSVVADLIDPKAHT